MHRQYHPGTISPLRRPFSLFVECGSDEEIERLYAALAADGKTFMPLGGHGFTRKFAWIRDRYGVSWQLNLT